jgi:hypothetical protein
MAVGCHHMGMQEDEQEGRRVDLQAESERNRELRWE